MSPIHHKIMIKNKKSPGIASRMHEKASKIHFQSNGSRARFELKIDYEDIYGGCSFQDFRAVRRLPFSFQRCATSRQKPAHRFTESGYKSGYFS
jgi:hypothetical protein